MQYFYRKSPRRQKCDSSVKRMRSRFTVTDIQTALNRHLSFFVTFYSKRCKVHKSECFFPNEVLHCDYCSVTRLVIQHNRSQN